MTPYDKPLTKGQAALIALALTLMMTGGALAQTVGGDTLGVTPVRAMVIATVKLIAGAGIAYIFLRLMAARHTMEGLALGAVGVLGIAKVEAIATFLGL